MTLSTKGDLWENFQVSNEGFLGFPGKKSFYLRISSANREIFEKNGGILTLESFE